MAVTPINAARSTHCFLLVIAAPVDFRSYNIQGKELKPAATVLGSQRSFSLFRERTGTLYQQATDPSGHVKRGRNVTGALSFGAIIYQKVHLVLKVAVR